MYQTQVNVQSFTSTFTFVPNGENLVFIINNSTNNPFGFNNNAFSAGAGCEADFFQGYNQTNPPNNVFALEFDSVNPLVNGNSFTYSSVQIYPSNPYVQCPCQPSVQGCGTNNSDSPITKISTSPVPLNFPAGAQETTSGDTYSATVTYDGNNLALDLYDVTAGGSCPGSSCFTNTWTGVNIPSSVGGSNTAWVGFGGATRDLPSSSPLYINSFVYNEGKSTSTPTPTSTPTVVPTITPTAISTPTPTATSTPSGSAACSPVYTAPVDHSTISGSVPVSIVPNCNAAASACGYFFRNYLPDGTTADNLGSSWTLDTTQYPNGSAALGVLVYNIGCGSFAGQTVFGLGIESFTIGN
jgi:hypothetical protein